MAIILSGTPGTGKTAIAKALAKKLRYEYVDVKKVIKGHALDAEYDKKRKATVIDLRKLNPILIAIIKKQKNCIIDSHLSHFLPKRYVDLCIITTCDIKILNQRLKKRGYSKEKIRENLDAEITQVILDEAQRRKHKILVVDTSKRTGLGKLIKSI